MKVLVCGGRDLADKLYIHHKLDELNLAWTEAPDCIIHGDAPGVDRLAGDWARARGIYEIAVPALWDWYAAQGNMRAAGMARNRAMLELTKPDLVVAFPGGKGTAGMVSLARKARIPVTEIA